MADGSTIPPRSQREPYYRPTNLHLRNLLTSERHSGIDQQRALDALNQEMSERSTEASITNSDRRRRDYDTHLQDSEVSPVAENLSMATTSPPPFGRSRIRATRPSQRAPRHRPSYYSQSLRPDSTTEHSGDYVHVTPASATPSAFTDNAMDEFLTEPHSNRDQRYRAKRRKLDDGTFSDESKITRYGDKGRVTSGPLKLEIVSCDGGEYGEQPPTGQAQHVLQDDQSVYSTKSDVCNMLLKHVGGMPFALTKIVFKAPADGYDAPLREGMIFVAMDDDKLLERAAQYDMQYSPKFFPQHHRPRQYDSWRPSQEYLQAGRSPPPPRHRSRASLNPYGYHSRHRFVGADPDFDPALVPGFEVTFADLSDTEDQPPNTSRVPARRRDTVTEFPPRAYTDRYRPSYDDGLSYVELSGTSEDSEDEDLAFRDDPAQDNRQLRLLNRMAFDRSEHDWPASYQSLRDSPDPRTELYRLFHSRRPFSSSVDPRQETSRLNEPTEANDATTSNSNKWTDAASRSTVAASSSNRLAPHARFSIHKHKSAIAVNFDPAISGRYILIKLWAPFPKANIDIQSIIAHGYGGPRFFPSREMR